MWFDKFIKIVFDNKENLRTHKYGRKIIMKLIQTYPETEDQLKLSNWGFEKFPEGKPLRKGSGYSGDKKRVSEYIPGTKRGGYNHRKGSFNHQNTKWKSESQFGYYNGFQGPP